MTAFSGAGLLAAPPVIAGTVAVLALAAAVIGAKIYLPRAVMAFLIAAPLWVGAFVPGRVSVLGVLGGVVWALELFFETVGDAQTERYTVCR